MNTRNSARLGQFYYYSHSLCEFSVSFLFTRVALSQSEYKLRCSTNEMYLWSPLHLASHLKNIFQWR